ncbi:MAG: fimbrillin family protein, partial [Bacteroidales bacterium]|nr:fimbrillin family protein [Bacteroidales bacterium]
DNTKISFFAYSPYSVDSDSNLGQTPGFSATDGITLTDYEHNDSRCENNVDFMIAAPQKDQKYSSNTEKKGTVKTVFSHQMSQVNFTIKRDVSIAEQVKLYLTSVELVDVDRKADFKSLPNPAWTLKNDATGYIVKFPDLAKGENGTEYADDQILVAEAKSSTPATMLPQTLTGESTTKVIKVTYKIDGTGVAKETVTRELKFTADWVANTNYKYNLTIKMNEILFEPSISADWSPAAEQNIEVKPAE